MKLQPTELWLLAWMLQMHESYLYPQREMLEPRNEDSLAETTLVTLEQALGHVDRLWVGTRIG